ncbi:MAG: SH3 domain-containing protein [Anaerolineales bacterium]|jgi:uncharacterized protein YraI
MPKKLTRFLWILTALAAVVLLAATVFMAGKARDLKQQGFSAFITNASSPVYMRLEPAPHAKIITILENGQAILVHERLEEDGITWYSVRAGNHRGWVLGQYISLEPPADGTSQEIHSD